MSINNDHVNIELTSHPHHFAICAMMMSVSDPWIKLGLDYDNCLQAFDGPLKEVYVLNKRKEIIGFVIIQTQGTFKGYIQTISINKKNRGGGYGTQLLQFCQNRILQYSPNIFICVSSFNHGAIQLYTKFGFELVGELKDFVKKGFTELLFRKTIGPIVGYKDTTKS